MPTVKITIEMNEAQANRNTDTADLMARVAKVLDNGDAEYHPCEVTSDTGEALAIVSVEWSDED